MTNRMPATKRETTLVALVICFALITGCSKSNDAGAQAADPNVPTQNQAPSSGARSLEDAATGRLTARLNVTPNESIGNGLHHLYLGLNTGRDGSIYVPQSYRPGHPAPMLLFLHGNRGDKTGVLYMWQDEAERTGTILVLPESRLRTWDRILGHQFGADLLFIDQSLKLVFSSLSIDPKHIAIGGFSDGASTSLSLGLNNGDLFTHVVGLSPGSVDPVSRVGQPLVFIMHGRQDDILDIDQTSRLIVPALRAQGYAVNYDEFDGQHLVVDTEKREMMYWFLTPSPSPVQ